MERTINIDRILLIAVIVAAVIAFVILRACNVSPYPAISENTVSSSIEHIDIPVPLPAMAVQQDSLHEKIVWRSVEIPIRVTDSTAVMRLITERDSLRQLLAANNIGVTFGIDTIHAVTRDTIHVLCDEISRSIMFAYNPAPRTVTVERETITITQQRRWGLGGTIGATITYPDGKLELRPGATFGFTYIIY